MAKSGGLMKKKELFSVELIFDNKDAAKEFVAWWLDGGGDGGGNLDWDTDYKESDKWDKRTPKFLRIKGTGYIVDEYGTVITPEMEQERMDKATKEFQNSKK